MLRNKSLLVMAAAAIMMSGTAFGQNCGSCGTCDGGQGAAFNYPSNGSCGAGGCRGGSHRDKIQQARERAQKVTARNDAWPKPFNCADRQAYASIWAPMLSAGLEQQCTLNDGHFDPSTHALNKFGVQALAGIMQNMPSDQKNVFVTQDADATISEARLESVRSTIKTYYSQIAPNAQVAYTLQQGQSIRGVIAENTQRMYVDGAPSPIIKISSGSDTVTSSVTQ